MFQQKAQELLQLHKFQQGISTTTKNWFEKKGHEIRLNEGGFIYKNGKIQSAFPRRISKLKRIIIENHLTAPQRTNEKCQAEQPTQSLQLQH